MGVGKLIFGWQSKFEPGAMIVETLMIPMARAEGLEVGGRSRSGRAAGERDFAGHLERRINEERRDDRNALGARRNEAAQARRGRSDEAGGAEREERRQNQPVEINALVGEYLGLLQEKALDPKTGPGSWRFTIDDPTQLSLLAARAGMSEIDTVALLQSFEHNQGVFEIGEFLGRLSRHFLGLTDQQPVPVAETELPYLQLILAKLGVPADQLEKIGELAVMGDNTLDLAALVRELAAAGLTGAEEGDQAAAGEITLTGWDAEQLLVVLEAAGVPKPLLRELLPELHAPWDQPQRPNLPLKLDLERFYQLLAQSVAEVKAGRPQPEIPEFLAQLKEIFARAGFAEQRVGWDPAIQGAVEKVYAQLLESIDLATIRVERPEQSLAANLKEQWAELDKFARIDKDLAANRETVRQALADSGLQQGGEQRREGEELFSGRLFLNELRDVGQGERAENGLAAAAPDAAESRQQEMFRLLNANSPRFNSQLEQQIFNRIATGVSGGLQRNEHHLVLHLYPRELGEVRVEMLVRDNQVALNFAMESTRVKEILEKNMDMFRENLERRGFQLGECMVSVDQQGRDEAGENWQRFVSAWTNQRGSGMVRRDSLAEVPESVLYQRPAGNSRENGIDIFA